MDSAALALVLWPGDCGVVREGTAESEPARVQSSAGLELFRSVCPSIRWSHTRVLEAAQSRRRLCPRTRAGIREVRQAVPSHLSTVARSMRPKDPQHPLSPHPEAPLPQCPPPHTHTLTSAVGSFREPLQRGEILCF